LLDTPGMRELSLWQDEGALAGAFADVAALAEGCRFPDCAHDAEPGCAVTAAEASGALAADRLASFRKLGREVRRMEAERDLQAQKRQKRSDQVLARALGRRRRGDGPDE